MNLVPGKSRGRRAPGWFQARAARCQRTQAYQPFLESAGLATPEAIERVGSVEQTRERLPAIELADFRGSPAAFASPTCERAALRQFVRP